MVDNVAEWARVSALEEGAEGFQNGHYGRNLAANHPKWAAKLIGRKIYHYTLAIMRGYGNDTNGSKIHSRKTVGQECETAMGGSEKTGNRSQ